MVDLVNHCEFSNSFLKKLKIVPEQLGTQWHLALLRIPLKICMLMLGVRKWLKSGFSSGLVMLSWKSLKTKSYQLLLNQ